MIIAKFPLCVLCIVCGLGAGAAAEPEHPVRVRWITGGTDATARVEVTGLDPAAVKSFDARRWQALLPVYVATAGSGAGDDTPPMAGMYQAGSGRVVFRPDFPPQPGVTYRAVLRFGSEPVVADFTAAARRPAPATVVAQVYPTAGRLPENLLKFYVHFSAPMRRGHIYDYIRLLDERGDEVELPFLEIDEELWNPEMTRLTLFIDPGRIKRGVAPLEDVGPALVSGKRFRLVIDREWQDAAGSRLGQSYEKRFEVGTPDRDPPDPETWKIAPPAAGGREALVIAFHEPLDHALALRLIRVTDQRGTLVAGTPEMADGEKRWCFRPDATWTIGRYVVTVQATVEDLAGNNIGKPFEVDLAEGAGDEKTPAAVKLPFEIR